MGVRDGGSPVKRWLNENAFLLALILVVLAVTPGYIRLENNVNEVEELVEHDRQGQLDRCRTSNDGREQIRQTFHDTFDQLQLLGADPALIEQLNAIVPRAEEQDLDCNGDGQLTEEDYSARPR
jgi:hypothetical protein